MLLSHPHDILLKVSCLTIDLYNETLNANVHLAAASQRVELQP